MVPAKLTAVVLLFSAFSGPAADLWNQSVLKEHFTEVFEENSGSILCGAASLESRPGIHESNPVKSVHHCVTVPCLNSRSNTFQTGFDSEVVIFDRQIFHKQYFCSSAQARAPPA